ncbi:unnamed protein product [Protopolystoma xenopodis]|uniref:SAC3/GANP/THP3 conserved domain-containing protein n=1 Tax=Protopolystoma xenopodis TaxID=117903 RepID=A0A448X1C3_9PLAT|nr:unnamed protein product [Protopolystoma xenopodis]
MDHMRAVKDYARSSADQAAPLPDELRPPEVLERTVTYLLAAIADRAEQEESTRSLWKAWYEFLWTRTRAIRKDVAQQGLCSPAIVRVMEAIARFHVFCAARLVDQPVDAFDPRINSENLTQCLQTLKEMYDDLRVQASARLSGTVAGRFQSPSSVEIDCPFEPEFRAYSILMSLNEYSVLK